MNVLYHRALIFRTKGTGYREFFSTLRLARVKELADKLCGGRCVFLLEGGYDLVGLAEGVTDSFRALLGDESAGMSEIPGLGEEPRDKVQRLMSDAKALHQL